MAQTNATLIWKIADLRRGRYNPNQYREPSQSPEAGDGMAGIDREYLGRNLR